MERSDSGRPWWRPARMSARRQRRFIRLVWALCSLATGYALLVLFMVTRAIEPAPAMALMIYGTTLAVGLSAWGVAYKASDARGRPILVVGGAVFPMRRLRGALNWSLLYIPMLLCWSVIITPGSAWFYVLPTVIVGVIFGGIVATFIDNETDRGGQ